MTECPIVETCYGKVKGRVIEKPFGLSKDVFNYQSIPFAKPPVGDLRFEAPQPPGNWEGVYDATTLKPSPQQDPEFQSKTLHLMVKATSKYEDDYLKFDEDCLYLNVYTTNPSKDADLPVMVWIYGGGFVMGGPGYYDGSAMSAHQNVVVVCLSYRVGICGFISFGPDSKCPGNNGFLDQVRGLEWVRDNIQAFGGNPNNVTIFGESAGGSSVGFHVLSPLSKGLFHRAISHSGTANIKTLEMGNPVASRKHLLSQLDITDEDPNEAMEKLKKVPFDKILPITSAMAKLWMFFGPIVDGKFLPESPYVMMTKKNWNAVPYMIGMNNTEGAGLLTMEQPVGFKDGITKSACKEYVKGMMYVEVDPTKVDGIADLILEEYSKGYPDEDKYKWSRVAGQVLGDLWFLYPGIDMAEAYSGNEFPTFMYYMTHTFPFYHHEEYYGTYDVIKKAPFCEADHGDDVILTFGVPLAEENNRNIKFSDGDKSLTNCWLQYLGNFARTGNPNGTSLLEWPSFKSESRGYMNLKYPLESGNHLYQQRTNFWRKFIKPPKKEEKGTNF